MLILEKEERSQNDLSFYLKKTRIKEPISTKDVQERK